MSDKVRENRLRRAAERRGLMLRKSHQRDPRGITFGCYALVDERTNMQVRVDDPIGRGYPFENLNQVEAWLNR